MLAESCLRTGTTPIGSIAGNYQEAPPSPPFKAASVGGQAGCSPTVQKFHVRDVNKSTVADLARMEEHLDRRKQEAFVALSLCTGTLIACFGIALGMLLARPT